MKQEDLSQSVVEEAVEDSPQEPAQNSNAPDDLGASQVDVNDLVASLLGWREAISDLLEQMPAETFQRLILRLLGDDGMREIQLTSNDAIEGIGVVGGGGFFSFRVSFRCIRGAGRVSSSEVEDFRREVMVGRADKGLLLTTGKFTQEAELKAASDRAPEIKLIGGDEFIDKLKDLKLGVKTEQVLVERVVIDEAWFAGV